VPLSCNLGTVTSWNPLGHSRPVTGLLYVYLLHCLWSMLKIYIRPILMLFRMLTEIFSELQVTSLSQWPRCLRRMSAAARLLRLWVRIPPGAWMFVCGECCVLSGRGLCDELITRAEESYRLCCVIVCDLETSIMRRPWPTGRWSRQKQTNK
jgi:hypothetical protein